MARSPEVIRHWMVRGSLAVIVAMAVLIVAGTIVFRLLLPYRERVIDYTPTPAPHATGQHSR